MKCNGKFAHSLRLDFHMTQRILAPVRFLDGLTGRNTPDPEATVTFLESTSNEKYLGCSYL
jgi:hypothetical protein